MPTKPKLPDHDPVDPDAFDELDEDALDDSLDLQDLEPVFTEEAPMVQLDDEEEAEEEAISVLPEDVHLGEEAPIDWSDEGEDEGPDLSEAIGLEDAVDWSDLVNEERDDLPALGWSQEVFVDELGRVLPAELDPTAESTTWFRPDVSRAAHRLSFTLGGEAVSTFPSVVRGSSERLRIGRDVLAGRFLVRS
ncbi:MAG: hypothetical protein KC912_12245 [Proteobacteria bacterium]|nr:hypothetical protein [Pseudomonadota bacterium]